VRTLHEEGIELARALALERQRFFKSRVPLYYLDALAVSARLEKRSAGSNSPEMEEELKLFEIWGAPGRRALLEAQGFLS
jgi:hypothetical protein